MSRFRPVPVAPSAVVAVLSIVATIGFRGIFADYAFVAPAVLGALAIAAVIWGCRSFGLGVPESLIVALLCFVLLGPVAAEGIPSLAAIDTFRSGLIRGWARILSSAPPAELDGDYRVLPYTVAAASALIGTTMLRSSRTGALAVAGPLVGLALTTVISLEHRTVALVVGSVFVVGGLTVAWLQRGAGPAMGPPGRRLRALQVLAALATAALCAAGAVLLGPQLPGAEAKARFNLRELQTPPFDPLRDPTPLGQLKVGLLDANSDKVMMRVASDEPIRRMSLAVLGRYTGEFWQVADETANAPAQFRPVDATISEPTNGTIESWESVTAEVEIVDLNRLAGGDYEHVWLPSPGWPQRITSETDLDLRVNRDTGTVAVAPDGPEKGLTYRIRAAVPPEIADVELADATVTTNDPTLLAAPELRAFAADLLEGADLGWEQVEAIRTEFVGNGAYDSRAGSSTARPGHHLGRLAEFVADPERIVGFEEQYAAAAALVLRSEGVPARVVVGFAIGDDELRQRRSGRITEFLASDMRAWIEVRFDGIGWMPFQMTPPRDRLPEDAPVGRTEREVAVPNPPPDPPPPLLPPDLEQRPEPDDTTPPTTAPTIVDESTDWGATVATGAIALPVLLALAVVMLIITMKRRRTSRRRRASDSSVRTAGAWHEIIDRAAEQGYRAPQSATTREIARDLQDTRNLDADARSALDELAGLTDRATHDARRVAPEAADAAWDDAETVRRTMSTNLGFIRKWRHQLHPRPLLARDPLRHLGDRRQPGGEQ